MDGVGIRKHPRQRKQQALGLGIELTCVLNKSECYGMLKNRASLAAKTVISSPGKYSESTYLPGTTDTQ